MNSQSTSDLQFIVVGHANLHRAANNAAQMAMHIHKQFRTFRLNDNGQVVKSNKVKSNAKRSGKPATVDEWKAQRKNNLSQGTPIVTNRRLMGRGQFYVKDEFYDGPKN